MAAVKQPLDARYRPFRIAVWAVYFVVLLFFTLSITVSVIKSVLEMTPDHRTSVVGSSTTDECLAKAKVLWVQLDTRRKAMSDQAQVSGVDADYWTQFRVQWLKDHRDAEASCAVDAPGRENLNAIFKRLDQTMDLYTTHAVQFAGEVGPTVDALKSSLGAAP
ncbi:MAG: hypothetical protein IPJ65_32630 [Archangiaceae bacterium]|nr:hypothetical protein [Archangiaceae bacterium]